MGYQEKNGVVTVFAKLTDLGKKYLLTDQARFNITKFSPADDEIDYRLWNENHDNGSAYYGAGIEALPLLEPVASSIFQHKYNLIRDLDVNTIRMPIVTLNPTSITLEYIDSEIQSHVLIQNVDEPQMLVILLDNTKADISAPGAQTVDVNPLAVQNMIGQSGFSYAKSFRVATTATITVSAKRNEQNFNQETKIIFVGTTTNCRAELPVIVKPNTLIQT